LFVLPSTAHPRIIALYHYWRSIEPAPGKLPGRRHFNPAAIPTLLPNLWLLDVVGEPRRFLFRVIGSELARLGIPARPGDDIEPLLPKARAPAVIAELERVIAARQPTWFRGAALIPHGYSIAELERLHLPLAANGADVDVLLCLTVFYDQAGAEITDGPGPA